MTGFSEAEISGELAPYLNPDYWGGHSIGAGESLDAPSIPIVGAVSVKNKLQRRLQTVNGDGPFESFEEGEVFDARELPAGTVVALSEEALSARPEETKSTTRYMKHLPIPERPRISSKSEVKKTSLSANGIDYISLLRLGIVADHARKGRLLHVVPAIAIHRDRGKVHVSGLPIPQKAPLRVGQTNHYRYKTGREKLVRVNLLEIMAFGKS